MIIKNILKEHKLSFNEETELADILIFSVKEIFPNLYESGINKNWTNWAIVNYVSYLDLPKNDYDKIVLITNRYFKLKAFI